MSNVIHNLEEFCDFIYDTLKEYWFVKRKPKIRKNTVRTYSEFTETFFFLKSGEAAKEILDHIQSCFGPTPMKHYCIHEGFAMTGQIREAHSAVEGESHAVWIAIGTTLGRWEPNV